MTDLRAAVADVYRQVDAPAWARPNLDGLADVLADLSWLPAGPVRVTVPALDGPGRDRLLAVLADAVARTADGPRPVLVDARPDPESCPDLS